MIAWLDEDEPFPPVEQALTEPSGLLAASADLPVSRLVTAYRRGIFPWFNPGEPVLWWSPDPRMVLYPAELHVPRSLENVLRHRRYTVTVDRAFGSVIRACAAPTPARPASWITPEIISTYSQLYRLGLAHSVETWIDGQLAGGFYGVMIGRMFYGESMFAQAPDASKIAFAHLMRRFAGHGIDMIDCQMHTAHLARFGGREIPRSDFVATVNTLTAQPAPPDLWRWSHCNELA